VLSTAAPERPTASATLPGHARPAARAPGYGVQAGGAGVKTSHRPTGSSRVLRGAKTGIEQPGAEAGAGNLMVAADVGLA